MTSYNDFFMNIVRKEFITITKKDTRERVFFADCQKTISKPRQSFPRQWEIGLNPFLGQLCRLKNTLRRAMRALVPTKEGV